MSARKEKKADLTLDPPAFTLEENPDLEIFTFRLPSRIPLQSLDKLEFDLSGTKPCTFQAGDVKYKLQLGTAVENESFRVLVPKAKKAKDNDSDESDDSDDDDNKKFLQPASIPFSRHYNVLSTTKELTERIVAPRKDKAPANVDPMFRAYAHVPQKTGLKRRWMPLGVPAVAAGVAEPKQLKSTTTTTATATPMKKESSPSKHQNGDKGKKSKSTTPTKEKNGTSSQAKPKRIKLEEDDSSDGGASSPLKKAEKKSAKKDKDKKEAKKDKKESKKKRKSSIKKEEEE